MAYCYLDRFTEERVPFTVLLSGSVAFELGGGLHGSTLLGRGASFV
jgi:hypothetical protein